MHACVAGLKENALLVDVCKALEEEGLPAPKSYVVDARRRLGRVHDRVTLLEWDWAYLYVSLNTGPNGDEFPDFEILLMRMNRGNIQVNSISHKDIVRDVRAHVVPEIRICMAQGAEWERKKRGDNMDEID